MKILILTQDDPFYLGPAIDYLLDLLPESTPVAGCVLFDVAPFGKKSSILAQAVDTLRTFGLRFFIRYSVKFLLSKLGIPVSIARVLERRSIPVIQLEQSINDPKSLARLQAFAPDLLVSIGGNQIFKRDLLDLAPEGCLNLHTALLPKYRGLMPSFWVMKNGEEETGVSVFLVDEGIDSGPIVVQKRIAIGERTQAQLIQDTKRLGMEAIAEATRKIASGDVTLIENPDSEMTYFSRPQREDVRAFLKAGKRFF